MSAASNYLEDKLLDHVLNFGNGSLTVGSGRGFAAPATVYVALFADSGSGVAAALESNTSGTDATSKFGYYENKQRFIRKTNDNICKRRCFNYRNYQFKRNCVIPSSDGKL